jgi:hypothetical protein
MYLKRADQAHTWGLAAELKSERVFYERMERRWMDLAASTAFVERVDLFLNTLEGPGRPHDACPRCQGLMTTEVIEASHYSETYTLRCRDCGETEKRMVVPAAPATRADGATGEKASADHL